MPERGTCAGVASAELETERLPICRPAFDGENASCAVQLAPVASEVEHVVNPSLNWLEGESARSASATKPVLVKVTVCDVPVSPTPVVAKLRDAGCTCIEPAAPPVPVRDAVAAATNADEVTVRAPVTIPFAEGAKTTPVEQLVPAPRAEAQLFCTRLKGGETESASPLAATPLVLVMIAVCAALT